MIQIGSIKAVPFPNQKYIVTFLLKLLGCLFLAGGGGGRCCLLNEKSRTPIPSMGEPECTALIGCFSLLSLSSLFYQHLVGWLDGERIPLVFISCGVLPRMLV